MENFKLFLWNFSLSTGTEIVKSTRRRRGTHRALKFGKSAIQENVFYYSYYYPKWQISKCFSLKIYIFYEPANRILSNNEIDFSKAIFYDFELSLLN